ncbi:MAG: helix-turn-helix transcriptional regulator [Clostridia bacterium]|nr:helix-turn-helix transcriptional regulator [Clostridia bacterium]
MHRIMIGKRVLDFRLEHGISQREFGDMLGVTSQAVSKWERGVCCPDISLLPELCTVLGVEMQKLFGNE